MSIEKKHILQVTGAMNMGGAEVMLMDIYRNLSQHFQFDFLINYNTKRGKIKGDFDEEIISRGGRISYIGAQWDIGPLRYLSAFKAHYQFFGSPSIVHIHMNAKSGVIAWAAKKAGAKKIIVHSHADLKIRGSRIKVFLSKLELKIQQWLMLRYATDYWGCSKEANESLFYSNVLTSSNAAIIKNAVDVQKFQNVNLQKVAELKKSYNLAEGSIILGNVGRIVKHKNIAFVIELLPVLREQGIDAHFVIAGREDDKEYVTYIKKRAKQLNVDAYITFLGSREDIDVVMQSFDIFIAPALQEGFGLVAVEAQAAGKPCVLYKGFPPLVDMALGLVQFQSDFEIGSWIQSIIKALGAEKPSNDKILLKIVQNGFDVQTNTKLIEQKYLE